MLLIGLEQRDMFKQTCQGSNVSKKMNQEYHSCEAVILNCDRFDRSSRAVVFARCLVVTDQVGLLFLHGASS